MEAILKKLMDAQSVEDVAEVLKAEGIDESMAERGWQEVCYVREQTGEELSLDELDAVSGGFEWLVIRRDWIQQDCAATVEPDSKCWGTDGGCLSMNVWYTSAPDNQPCAVCGARYTFRAPGGNSLSNYNDLFKCRDCGTWFYFQDRRVHILD